MFKFALALLSILFFVSFAESEYREEIDVEAVNIVATARDLSGHPVRDLRPEDITVLENGVPQPLLGLSYYAQDSRDMLSGRDEPLSVAFVLDTSKSMASSQEGKMRIDLAMEAMEALMAELQEDDEAMLVTFTRYPRVVVPKTHDLQRMKAVMHTQTPAQDRTAIYDSLSVVLDEMAELQGRKILVLCTDGEDTASKMKFEELLQKLGASDVLVLAFTIPSNQFNGQFTVRRMAQITGGHAFFPTTTEELKLTLQQLRKSMRNQYSIWYRPSTTGSPGHWRTIQIQCRRPGIELNHRPGYFTR